MQNKRTAVVICLVLVLSAGTANLSGAHASSTTTKAAAKAAAAKAAAAQKAQWAKAAAAAKSAADAEGVLMSAYQTHIDTFANSVPLYLVVASAYRTVLLTSYTSLTDFQNALSAVQSNLQARKIDTSRRLDSLLANALGKMNSEVTAASTVRGQALGRYESATAVLPASTLEQNAQAKVAAASVASGAKAAAANKAADDAMVEKERLMIAASDASHALDPAMSAANAALESARETSIACCGTQGVYATPEVAAAAQSNFNKAKTTLDALSLEYDVKLYAYTVAWAEYGAARYNDLVVSLSGSAQTTAIWVAFYKVAYEAYSVPPNSARDAIWSAYLNSAK